jgi:7-carboxy-7-deazaguanine synthase
MNTQKPERRMWDVDGRLVVHSYFHTIQGEGPFAGHYAFFIRLNGCNLQCPGCDTEYTSQREYFSPGGILDLVRTAVGSDYLNRLVVITGGEPFRQNIAPAIEQLLGYGFRVQVETNGTLAPDPSEFPWHHPELTVVVSPKTGVIHEEIAYRAKAYKYVLRADDIAEDGLPTSALGHTLGKHSHVARPPTSWQGPIYLQPMDEKDADLNLANERAVVASVMTHRKYIMGVQMHKLTGLP